MIASETEYKIKHNKKMSTTAAAASDAPVKSDLFKDVKYYVNGTLVPEVRVFFHAHIFAGGHFNIPN